MAFWLLYHAHNLPKPRLHKHSRVFSSSIFMVSSFYIYIPWESMWNSFCSVIERMVLIWVNPNVSINLSFWASWHLDTFLSGLGSTTSSACLLLCASCYGGRVSLPQPWQWRCSLNPGLWLELEGVKGGRREIVMLTHTHTHKYAYTCNIC